MREAVDRLAALAAVGVQLANTGSGTLRVLCGSLSPSERRGVTDTRREICEALRAGRAPASVSAGEVHRLAVRDWLTLPVPSTVYAETLEGRQRFAATVSRVAYQRCRDEGVPVFVGGEVEAVGRGVEHDLCPAAWWRQEVERKREAPEGRLRIGVSGPAPGPITWGQLAWALDFRLLEARAERSAET